MATYNLTPSQTSVPASALGLINGRVPCVVETVVDFSSILTLPSNVTAISGTSGTVIDCINVPAGFAILSTGVEVLLKDSAGNSGTLQVKVGSSSQGSAVAFSAALGFLATAGTMTPVVPSGSNAFITLTVGTGTVNGIVRVFATLLDQRARLGGPVFAGTQTNPAGQTTAYGVDPVANYTGTNLLTYVL